MPDEAKKRWFSSTEVCLQAESQVGNSYAYALLLPSCRLSKKEPIATPCLRLFFSFFLR